MGILDRLFGHRPKPEAKSKMTHTAAEERAPHLTAGPWGSCQYGNGKYGVETGFDAGGCYVPGWHSQLAIVNREGDARLMAAAPDLLEALTELYHKTICGTDDERHAALNVAWAAITKAVGQ